MTTRKRRSSLHLQWACCASQGTVVGPGLAKTGRDRAAGVEEELVDLPAWSAEEEDEEERAAAAGPEPEVPAVRACAPETIL